MPRNIPAKDLWTDPKNASHRGHCWDIPGQHWGDWGGIGEKMEVTAGAVLGIC